MENLPRSWAKAVDNSSFEYIREHTGIFGFHYDLVELNPTGRWQIYFEPKYNQILIDIEHKSKNFPYQKRWVCETEIIYCDSPLFKKTYNCN
jgi:hypothetical protein